MKKSNIDQWICDTEGLTEITREKLEELQLFRLNKLLNRFRERGGTYKELTDTVSSLEKIKTLPFTTAEMIAKNPGNYLLTSQSEVSRVISGATSGTTGPAKRVFYTEKDTEHTVEFFAAGIGEMVRPGEKVMIAFPFTGPFGLGDLIEQAVVSLGAASVRAGHVKTYGELCDLIQDTKPDCYIGFPVRLLSAIRFFNAHYYGSFPIKRALISGDACPKGVVAELERLLGSRLFPHYGSRETGLSGAITCPAHEGMHIKENHMYVEIIDETLEPVPDGSWGELVVTTFGLEAMPLLRYRTGDRARILPEACPCGSVTKRLDMVSRLSEEESFMEAMDSLLFTIPELIDYRAVKKNFGVEIMVLSLRGNVSDLVKELLHKSYPKLSFEIVEEKCKKTDNFLYLGKRSSGFSCHP